MKFQEVIDILTERRGKAYPTAPLHSEGTEVMGYVRPGIYVGWRIQQESDECKAFETEWHKFRKSEKSELPNMVKDFKALLEAINEILEEHNSTGDEEQEWEQRVKGIGSLCLRIKILQELEEEDSSLVHCMEMNYYGSTISIMFANILIALPINGGASSNGNAFPFDDLHLKLDEKKKELLRMVEASPKLAQVCKNYGFTADNVGAFIDGHQSGGTCYDGG